MIISEPEKKGIFTYGLLPTGQTYGSLELLATNDYCWRLPEYFLILVNEFIKEKLFSKVGSSFCMAR